MVAGISQQFGKSNIALHVAFPSTMAVVLANTALVLTRAMIGIAAQQARLVAVWAVSTTV